MTPTPTEEPEGSVDPIVLAIELAVVAAGPVAWALCSISLTLLRREVRYAALCAPLFAIVGTVTSLWLLVVGTNPIALYVEGVTELLTHGPSRYGLLLSTPACLIVSLLFVWTTVARPAGARRHLGMDEAKSRWVSACRIDLQRSLPLSTRKGVRS